MDHTINEYRWARNSLKTLTAKIKRTRDEDKALCDERIALFRELDEAGIARTTIAKWAGVDPMIITRALRDDAPEDE